MGSSESVMVPLWYPVAETLVATLDERFLGLTFNTSDLMIRGKIFRPYEDPHESLASRGQRKVERLKIGRAHV